MFVYDPGDYINTADMWLRWFSKKKKKRISKEVKCMLKQQNSDVLVVEF